MASRKPAKKKTKTNLFSPAHFGLAEASGSKPTKIQVSTLSQDGRRIISQSLAGPSIVPAPAKKGPDSDSSNFTYDFAAQFFAGNRTKKVRRVKRVKLLRRKRYATSDYPMQVWKQRRDDVLAEMMRAKGRGSFAESNCPLCSSAPAEFRCSQCLSNRLLCKACCLKEHHELPLHRIKQWTGKCFVRVSLYDLGSFVQLGHDDGSSCPAPSYTRLTVIHVNGLHHLRLAFCACSRSAGVKPWQQLMRLEWYPATLDRTRTVATFAVLNLFHKATLEGKSTTYDFYSALEKLTNNAGQIKFTDRYRDFLRIMRQWRHLKMLMRGGRGNDGVRNVEQTALGELAVTCPACPHPDINLPADWQTVEADKKYLYYLFIAIDACFRLKRKLVSSLERDPYLQPGMAYLVDPEPYRQYLLTVTDQEEMCTCTGLAALDYANTRRSRGYAQTGIAMCCCARHEIVGKNGAAPLQVGERYCNIDYGIASFLQHVSSFVALIFSYDIVCQWYKKCMARLQHLPPKVRIDISKRFVKFLIPKLHIYGHKLLCQLAFSFNLTPGVGRTDAEGIERGWADTGPVATSTKEMGPGSHADTLEDHWGHRSWKKIVGFGLLFRKRMLKAIKELKDQEEEFTRFTVAQGDSAAEWKRNVEAFEADPSQRNPYELQKSGLGLQEIRAEIAKEDAEVAREAQRSLFENDTNRRTEDEATAGSKDQGTEAEFLMAGLEIEEHQRQLKIDVSLVRDPTPTQTAVFTETRNRLTRKITHFRSLQARHCRPALPALALHPTSLQKEPPLAEDVPLLLPSSLSLPSSEFARLLSLESRLRDGQCRDALDQLRNNLLIRSRLNTYRKSSARHQGATTRTRAKMNRHERKIKLSTQRYQAAYRAKLALVGGDESQVGWHKLEQKDVKAMRASDNLDDGGAKKRKRKTRRQGGQDEVSESSEDSDEEDRDKANKEKRQSSGDEGDGPGEGFRKISWIWIGADNTTLATDGLLHAALEVEWCKQFARVRRWREEICLLEEEMRRTIVYLEWKACWWESKADVERFEGAHREGVAAYAHEQAAVWRSLKTQFEFLWQRNSEGTFINLSKRGHPAFDRVNRAWVEGGRFLDAEDRGQQISFTAVDSDTEEEEEEELVEVEEEEDAGAEAESLGTMGWGADEEGDDDVDYDAILVAGKYASTFD